MALAHSFAPLAGNNPRVLILGTMPGQASLTAVEYYAHPRNAFWPILYSVFSGQDTDFTDAHAIAYTRRVEFLKQQQLALWDVLASCERPGSLDASIDRQSEVANPLGSWIEKTAALERVCFNGKTAQALFKRHVQNDGASSDALQKVDYFTLPSTSPAMASMTLAEKIEAWKPALML